MSAAVIFDLDGTLLDTLTDLAEATNAVLQNWGLPTHPTEAYIRMIGNGADNLLRRALPPGHSDERVKVAVELMLREYAVRWRENTRPYPGIEDLLDALSERSVCMAVLSNKPHRETTEMVTQALARWTFSGVFGQRDDVPRKPDPTAAHEAAALLAASPEEVLFVGDSETDMETAVRAGMTPVGVSWGFRPVAELREAGAQHILERPADLLRLL